MGVYVHLVQIAKNAISRKWRLHHSQPSTPIRNPVISAQNLLASETRIYDDTRSAISPISHRRSLIMGCCFLMSSDPMLQGNWIVCSLSDVKLCMFVDLAQTPGCRFLGVRMQITSTPEKMHKFASACFCASLLHFCLEHMTFAHQNSIFFQTRKRLLAGKRPLAGGPPPIRSGLTSPPPF